MVKQIGLLHYTRVLSLFLMLTHLFISTTSYNSFSTTLFSTYQHFNSNAHQECDQTSLKENNRTPIKCNGNYCSNFSSFFTASFTSFRFKGFEESLESRFFLYNDPPYSSFFNSIWIPPKIKV